MRYIILIALFLSMTSTAFAKLYVVEDDNNRVWLIDYVEGSKDSLDIVLRDLGLNGKIPEAVDASKLPPMADKKYWRKVGKNIVVDQAAKQADLAAQAQLEAEQAAIFLKLGITKEEYEKIRKVK